MLYFSVNGVQTRHIDIADRGLAYGDGIFTTALIRNGKIALIDLHLARLIKGCQFLSIENIEIDALSEELISVASPHQQAVLKVIITAGSGGRGYSKIGCTAPKTIVSVFPFPEHYNQWQTHGITLGLAKAQLGLNPMLAGLKHLNRLEQVKIRQELDQVVFDDVIVTDLNERIIETSCANIFWMKNNHLYTPDLSQAGVIGVMREHILNVMSDTISVTSTIRDLDDIDAMFICNSVMEIVPVNHWQEKALNIVPVQHIKDRVLGVLDGC